MNKGSYKDTKINRSAMLTLYYLGTGPRNIGNILSFLGIPGDHL